MEYKCHKNSLDGIFDKRITTCTCCVDTLTKLIRKVFRCGDVIGLTFIETGVASIATGIFQEVLDGVVIVKDLLLPDTTSFVSLCDVNSVEKGIVPDQSGSPMSVKLS